MGFCTDHVWKQIFKTPQGLSSRTAIDWCGVCGTVQVRTAYFEIMREYKETLIPQNAKEG